MMHENLLIQTNQDATISKYARDFKIAWNNFKIFQHFKQYATCKQQYTTCKLSRAYNREFSYMLFLYCCSYYSSMHYVYHIQYIYIYIYICIYSIYIHICIIYKVFTKKTFFYFSVKVFDLHILQQHIYEIKICYKNLILTI